MPSTPFIGVRSSWLIIARKSDLASVGLFGLLTGLDQLGNGPLAVHRWPAPGRLARLLMWRARWPSFAVIDHGQGVVLALLDGLDRMAHVADRLGQARARRRASKKVNSRANSARMPALITISCWRWLKASSDMPTMTRPR